MPRSRPFSYRNILWILVFVSIPVGMFTYERHYINYHAPLIAAGLADANRDGGTLLEEMSVPPGAKVLAPIQKRIYTGGRRTMWSDTQCALQWTGEWDVPLEKTAMLEWYRDRLLGAGWQPYIDRFPSKLQTTYFKDKWLLTLQHNVTFATDRPPHARIGIELKWDYWYKLAETSAVHAADRAQQGK